jgi:hypothetical protein
MFWRLSLTTYTDSWGLSCRKRGKNREKVLKRAPGSRNMRGSKGIEHLRIIPKKRRDDEASYTKASRRGSCIYANTESTFTGH